MLTPVLLGHHMAKVKTQSRLRTAPAAFRTSLFDYCDGAACDYRTTMPPNGRVSSLTNDGGAQGDRARAGHLGKFVP